MSVLSDRSQTIRASVNDMQLSFGAIIILVMLAIFVFVCRGTSTIMAGVTIRLSLAATFTAMYHLFVGSDGGAEHWAILASLIATCIS
jgi:multidrug efflux pump subunit AcrB